MGLTIPQVLHHNVRHFAQKCAVTIDDQGLSFQALAAPGCRRAGAASARTSPPGDRVAIWMPNSFAWIASFLAIQELKAVAVPISTRLTRGRGEWAH